MPTISIDMSDKVLCDDCDKMFTSQSPDVGGILFQRKAICPACAPKWEASAMEYAEWHFIADRAAPGETFFAAVMRWRDGNHAVTISGSREFVDDMAADYAKRTGGA